MDSPSSRSSHIRFDAVHATGLSMGATAVAGAASRGSARVVAVTWSAPDAAPEGAHVTALSEDGSVCRVSGEHSTLRSGGDVVAVASLPWPAVDAHSHASSGGLYAVSAPSGIAYVVDADTAANAPIGASRVTPVIRQFETDAGRAAAAAATSARWSPDGARLAVGIEDGTVNIWDISSGALHASFAPRAGDAVRAVRWAPEGRRIAVAAGRAVYVTALQAARRPAVNTPIGRDHGSAPASRRLPVNSPVLALDWAVARAGGGGDAIAAGSEDGVVRIWRCTPDGSGGDSAALSLRFVMTSAVPASPHPITALAWSPTGELLAAGSFESMWICSRDGAAVAALPCDAVSIAAGAPAAQPTAGMSYSHATAHSSSSVGSIGAVSWSADGLRLAGGGSSGAVIITTLCGYPAAVDAATGAAATLVTATHVSVAMASAPAPAPSLIDEAAFESAPVSDDEDDGDGGRAAAAAAAANGGAGRPPQCEDLVYREAVTAVAAGYGVVIIATTAQIHVYRVGDWGRSVSIDTRAAAHTLLLGSGGASFASIDPLARLSLYTVDGRLLSTGLAPAGLNASTAFASSGTALSLCVDAVAAVERATPGAGVHCLGAGGGRPVAAPLIMCGADVAVHALALSNSHSCSADPSLLAAGRRLIAALGSDGGLSIAQLPPSLNAGGSATALPRSAPVRLRGGVTDFAWHDSEVILAAVCEGTTGTAPHTEVIVWLCPSAAFAACTGDGPALCDASILAISPPSGVPPPPPPPSLRVRGSHAAPLAPPASRWDTASAPQPPAPCWGTTPLIVRFGGAASARLVLRRSEDGGALLHVNSSAAAVPLLAAARSGEWPAVLAVARAAGGVGGDGSAAVPHLWACAAALSLAADPPALTVAAAAFDALGAPDRAAYFNAAAKHQHLVDVEADVAAYRGDVTAAEAILARAPHPSSAQRAVEMAVLGGRWDHALDLVTQLGDARYRSGADVLLQLRASYLASMGVAADPHPGYAALVSASRSAAADSASLASHAAAPAVVAAASPASGAPSTATPHPAVVRAAAAVVASATNTATAYQRAAAAPLLPVAGGDVGADGGGATPPQRSTHAPPAQPAASTRGTVVGSTRLHAAPGAATLPAAVPAGRAPPSASPTAPSALSSGDGGASAAGLSTQPMGTSAFSPPMTYANGSGGAGSLAPRPLTATGHGARTLATLAAPSEDEVREADALEF